MDVRARLILALRIVAVAWFATGSEVRAQDIDPSGGVVGQSLNPAPQLYFVGGQRYSIPRNFNPTGSTNDSRSPSSISMRAFFPDVTGLTREDVPCLAYWKPCHDREIIIGIEAGERPAGKRRLQNMHSFLSAKTKVGVCNFEYYETVGHPSGRMVYFITRERSGSDVSMLRCSNYNSQIGRLCSSAENIGDGNRFYFVFASSRICDWPNIRDKILERIKSFKEAAQR